MKRNEVHEERIMETNIMKLWRNDESKDCIISLDGEVKPIAQHVDQRAPLVAHKVLHDGSSPATSVCESVA
jgi:hypothetical protein